VQVLDGCRGYWGQCSYLLPTFIQEYMNWSLESEAWIQVLPSVLPRRVALSKLLYLSEPEFFPSVKQK